MTTKIAQFAKNMIHRWHRLPPARPHNPLSHSLTRPPTHSLTHSLTHSFTHSLTKLNLNSILIRQDTWRVRQPLPSAYSQIGLQQLWGCAITATCSITTQIVATRIVVMNFSISQSPPVASSSLNLLILSVSLSPPLLFSWYLRVSISWLNLRLICSLSSMRPSHLNRPPPSPSPFDGLLPGSLPASFCKLRNLATLNVSQNLLTGEWVQVTVWVTCE